jgi:hypothetical protein
MDLGRFIQVAWRFRLLLGIGFTLAILLAVLSFARVGSGGLQPREQETWLSASTLLVTQEGFPWGRAILDETVPLQGTTDSNGESDVVPRFGDPGRYSGLASLYAELAKADEVQAEVAEGSKPGQYYESMVVQQPGSSASLPMIYIKGYGPTPEDATDTAGRASRAFIDYIEREQSKNKISDDKRVEVVVTKQATTPEIFKKRSFVRPIMLFLLVSMAFLALAFAFENLRTRRPQDEELEPEFADFDDLWGPEPEVERQPEPASSHRPD